MSPEMATRAGSLSGNIVDQFQILDLVGTGGMGEVYRAQDTRLNRVVAIKAPSDSVASDPIARRRFVRETKLAARVVHPNVATVFEVVDSDERLLLVMEFIEGNTLSELLRRGPVDPAVALRWAREIAEGLRAIHRAGLVHRDLKPGNVMISTDGHAKVTDFGLAVRTALPDDATTDTDLTRPDGLVGTLLYMSPEQLCRHGIDHRSDLFSFGVLLYEMLTNEHPFARRIARASAEAIVEKPPGEGALPKILTRCKSVRDLIFRLLEKNPADRYQDTQELLEDLGRIDPKTLGIWPTRNRVLATLAVIVVVVLGVAWWVNQPLSWDRDRVSIAFVAFQDRTGEPDAEFRGIMAADLLASLLVSSNLVRVLGPDETAPLLSELPPDADPSSLVERILSGATADYVALGNLYREDGMYAAKISLFPGNDQVPEIRPVQARAASVTTLADNLAWSLRRSLPAVSTITVWRDRTQIAEITSTSEEARMLYERGLTALRDGKLDEAIERFERAVEIDSSFVMAQAQLAVALREEGFHRRAREAAAQAVRLAPQPDSRATERLSLILSTIHARVFDRNEAAAQAAGRLVTLYPDEPALLELYGVSLYKAGRSPEALVRLDQALEIDELRASAHVARASVLVRLHRGVEGLEALDRAERIYEAVASQEGLAHVDYMRGTTLIDLERFEEARVRLGKAIERYRQIGSPARVAKILLESAKADIVRGNAAAAEEKLTRALEIGREVGNRRHVYDATFLAGVQKYRQGKLGLAEQLLREAVDLGRQLENDFVVYPQFNLGSLLNYLGRLDEARGVISECMATATRLGRMDVRTAALRTLADIDYQLGDLDAAIGAYRDLIREADGETSKATAKVYLRFLEIYESSGELGEALAAADQAVETYRVLETPGDLGYALVGRARVYGQLGRHGAARADLADARAIANSPEAGLDDLLTKCLLTEASLHIYEGQWEDAVAVARRAAYAASSGPPVDLALALSLDCQGSIGLNKADAPDRCEAAATVERAPAASRVHAEALLSEALWRANRFSKARESAAAVLASAEQMKLHLPLARAAAVLASLSGSDRPVDAAVIRQSGHRALEAYFKGAPGSDGQAVRQGSHVRWLRSVLESSGLPNGISDAAS